MAAALESPDHVKQASEFLTWLNGQDLSLRNEYQSPESFSNRRALWLLVDTQHPGPLGRIVEQANDIRDPP
ncbi:hypothetical protein ACQP2U_33050 [Nocardia sp. CA-084685]|uniref:hypothetical protein n=1 Tax=Nocardia sp. CA-084685 TaxID=3239970 RepID=UPI003D96EA23